MSADLPPILTVSTVPFDGQKMGTSGLRCKVSVISQPNYFENFVEAIFRCVLPPPSERSDALTLILGGDGRYWNDEALHKILCAGAAHGVDRFVVGLDGILSTPAVSCMIRRLGAAGGLILTASHNAGGPSGDFGIKFNVANGGPAPVGVTSRIFEATKSITSYQTIPLPRVDLSTVAQHTFTRHDSHSNFRIDVVDSVSQYEDLMRSIFDWEKISALVGKSEFSLLLDGMHGVTGPYLRRLFGSLGVSDDSMLNSHPLPDFGGGHPDPNLTYAAELVARMRGDEFTLGAAFDGDGDRNMILGPNGLFVNPSDSLAVIVHYLKQGAVTYYTDEGRACGGGPLVAVARSMPTSAALDRVVHHLGELDVFVVPTGWKFFGNVMDHYAAKGASVVCGEESFGTGSSHVREKDGIWAVLAWLSILAHTGKSVEEVLQNHWNTYGRNFYSRLDYEAVDADAAREMMHRLEDLQGKKCESLSCEEFQLDTCDSFEYRDTFDESVTSNQGLRFLFKDGSRVVFRLSGTGSVGATIRIYVEKFSPSTSPKEKLYGDAQVELKPLVTHALTFSRLEELTGRKEPSVIT